MRSFISPLLAAVLLLGVAAPVAAAPARSDGHARQFYLSLGDSLAAGVPPIGDPADLYRTSDGYAERLLEIGRSANPKLDLVKLGCPGESTTTMIHGGICGYPHGSQLDEATSFLRAHRAFVAFVTIDLGANDLPCNDLPCVPTAIASIRANLPTILTALRAAAGPEVPIVGMNLYNPLLAAWFLGPDGQVFAQGTTFFGIVPINDALEDVFATAGAGLADVEGAFSTTDFTTLVAVPGVGDVPLNVVLICAWTWSCAPPPYGPDNHANANGYRVIARAFAGALGL